jgi:hypothetical protein
MAMDQNSLSTPESRLGPVWRSDGQTGPSLDSGLPRRSLLGACQCEAQVTHDLSLRAESGMQFAGRSEAISPMGEIASGLRPLAMTVIVGRILPRRGG